MVLHAHTAWENKLPDDSWDQELFVRGGHFLQSTHWGAVHLSLGRRVFFGQGDGWQCLAILERSNRVTRLYCPRGPTSRDEQSYLAAIQWLQTLGQREGATFIRVEPLVPLEKADLVRLGHKPALTEIEPSVVLEQDLRKSKEQLLSEFSLNNRQRFRNARKKGLQIEASKNSADVRYLLQMVHEVAVRNQIVPHPDEHYRHLADVLLERDAATLYIVRHEGDAVSAAIVFDSPTTRHVGHSGGLHSARRLNPGVLMRATMILDAKERGQRTFDSLGVAPPDEPDHAWAGMTKFKKSFGGTYRHYLGTWEVPCSGWYSVYRSAYFAYVKVNRLR
ncbi:lipid II:glycine glycyltransferase FemX [Plantactinospora sp. WMMB334]|uniref:lipid II:glycine glycyltransferase FemX n=1 Tax=Plantactinospora sp. WMMB334 TaxID=3404119 RepID=UPI003B92BB27